MNRQEVMAYMGVKRQALLDYPFGEEVAVYKIGGKMFALINSHEKDRLSINLKYHKDSIHEIRSVFKDIIPGYHMNKNHWNTIYLDGDLEEDFIKELIDKSYDIVFNSLTKKLQKELLEL